MQADRSFFRRHAVAAAVLIVASAVLVTGLLSRQSQAEELRTAVAERTLPIVKLVTLAVLADLGVLSGSRRSGGDE